MTKSSRSSHQPLASFQEITAAPRSAAARIGPAQFVACSSVIAIPKFPILSVSTIVATTSPTAKRATAVVIAAGTISSGFHGVPRSQTATAAAIRSAGERANGKPEVPSASVWFGIGFIVAQNATHRVFHSCSWHLPFAAVRL